MCVVCAMSLRAVYVSASFLFFCIVDTSHSSIAPWGACAFIVYVSERAEKRPNHIIYSKLHHRGDAQVWLFAEANPRRPTICGWCAKTLNQPEMMGATHNIQQHLRGAQTLDGFVVALRLNAIIYMVCRVDAETAFICQNISTRLWRFLFRAIDRY